VIALPQATFDSIPQLSTGTAAAVETTYLSKQQYTSSRLAVD
jgi:hypothetical protein